MAARGPARPSSAFHSFHRRDDPGRTFVFEYKFGVDGGVFPQPQTSVLPDRLAAMSEALASSATLRPGPGRSPARVRPVARPVQLGTRYLGLLSAWAVAIGLAFKSELLNPNQVWQATAGLVVLVTLGLVFLHARNRTPAWL